MLPEWYIELVIQILYFLTTVMHLFIINKYINCMEEHSSKLWEALAHFKIYKSHMTDSPIDLSGALHMRARCVWLINTIN